MLLKEEKNNSEKLLLELTQALATTIDAKDKYTSGHSRRVAEYSKMLASALGKDEKTQQEIYLQILKYLMYMKAQTYYQERRA